MRMLRPRSDESIEEVRDVAAGPGVQADVEECRRDALVGVPATAWVVETGSGCSMVALRVRGTRGLRWSGRLRNGGASKGSQGRSPSPSSSTSTSPSTRHPRDWSYPYSVWLPYASYFVGGIAFHESPSVPAYAASHGCVRVPRDDAPLVYSFAALHLPVTVVR